MHIGQLIKEKRESLGWTKTELGKKLGVTYQAVSDMEKTKSVGVEILKKLNAPNIFGEGYFPLRFEKEVFDFEAFEKKRLNLLRILK